MGYADDAVAVLIGLVVPALGYRQQRQGLLRAGGPGAVPKVALYWNASLSLVVLCAAAVLAWLAAARPLAELGLQAPERPGTGAIIAAVFLVLYLADTRHELSPRRIEATRLRWRRNTPFLPQTGRELAHSMVLVTAASVCEEIMYRGFLIAYLIGLLGASGVDLTLAVSLPAIAFALAHTYQGGQAVVKIVALAVIFGAIFVVTGSLWLSMALHFVVDAIGMLLGRSLLGAPGARAAEALDDGGV